MGTESSQPGLSVHTIEWIRDHDVAGAFTDTYAHTGVQAVPGEARAAGRKRELLPPEHLHASGALACTLAEGRLPEERGLLDHGLGVVALVGVSLVLGAEALAGKPRLARLGDAHDEALDVLGVGHHAAEGEAVVGAPGGHRSGRSPAR